MSSAANDRFAPPFRSFAIPGTFAESGHSFLFDTRPYNRKGLFYFVFEQCRNSSSNKFIGAPPNFNVRVSSIHVPKAKV
jgi:hypothetical protein